MDSAASDALPLTSEPSDSDDIRWALETASAMWNKGDHREALRWLRRAAETASEEGDDARAVQLAKAAADLRGQLSIPGTEPPPAAALAAPTVERPSGTALRTSALSRSRPPPAPSTRARSAAATSDEALDRAAEALLGAGPSSAAAWTSGPETPRSASPPSSATTTPLGLRPPSQPPPAPVNDLPSQSLVNDRPTAEFPSYFAVRVALSRSKDDPTTLSARILAPGEKAPAGSKEALCVSLEPGTHPLG